MEIPIDLTCWFLNSRRVMELVTANYLWPRLVHVTGLADDMRRYAELEIQTKAVVQWLKLTNPPTLGALLATGRAQEGSIFTHHANFTFSGLPRVSNYLHTGKRPVPLARGTTKLDDWMPGCKLAFSFSHEHLTSTSAWAHLSGQRRLLVLGLITSITDKQVEAIPYLIAHPVSGNTSWDDYGQYWGSYLEISVDSIDSFSRVCDVRPRLSEPDLQCLRAVPETEIKAAFASIVNEPFVPKDWSGERSDMLSDRVRFRGQRIATAFLFKGPAQFRPMTLSELGKNGDQIDRLFTEPADLFVLQHCHQVTPPVRGTMRAYAQQTGRPRLFCIIDGFDTIRILKAYQLCGLGETMFDSKRQL